LQDHNTAMAASGGFVTGLTFFPPNTPAGYTRLEEYLHFLAIPHATIPRNTADGPTFLSVDLRRYTSGFNKAPVNFNFTNVTNGTVALQPDGFTLVFTPTLNFAGRARFEFTVTDGDGGTWTQTFGVLVSSAALPRDLKWKGDGRQRGLERQRGHTGRGLLRPERHELYYASVQLGSVGDEPIRQQR
jgi:hypothetical protein